MAYVDWLVRVGRAPLGPVTREGRTSTVPAAKAAVEAAVKELGTVRMLAQVSSPRGQWEFRPHRQVSGRMVWVRF